MESRLSITVEVVQINLTDLDSSKSTKLEIRIAIAVFIHALIAAIVSFLYVAAFYIWPERILDLLGFMYVFGRENPMIV